MLTSSLAEEVKSAFRAFRREPGFAFAVAATLALGIGSTAVVFTFVNGVLLRPLPYPSARRLVMICETGPGRSDTPCVASPANWADWSRQVRSLETLGLARDWTFGVREQGRIRSVPGGVATPGLFETFGVRPALGRLFGPRDVEPGSTPVVLIGHDFWHAHLRGRQDVLAETLEIDGRPHQVIGVLPPGFSVPRVQEATFWVPLWPERLSSRSWRGFLCFGRLAQGARLAQARAEFDASGAALARTYPETNAGWGVRVDSLHDRIVRGVRPALLTFLAAVALVLLIACANVAHLFLARGASREREFAVRLALGAAPGRLIRTLLIEGATLALCGGAAGVLAARWTVDVIRGLAPDWIPQLDEVRLDGQVLVFSLAVTFLASLLFSLAPAVQASRVDLNRALRDAGSAGRPGAMRARESLVVAETALACVLLVGAGLLLRSFGNLLDWSPGFDRSNLAIVQVFSSPGKYASPAPLAGLYRRAVEEIAALPSVAAAGAGSAVPLFGGDGAQEFVVEGRDESPGVRPVASWYDVDPDYFRTLGLPLVRGRFIAASDGPGSLPVAVINETMARRHFGGEDPIGRHVRMMVHNVSFEVVGVVGDVHPFRPDEPPEPAIFWPFAQFPRYAIMLVTRTAGPPESVLSPLPSRLEALDPDLDIGRIRTMDELVAGELVNPRFHSAVAGGFALAALLMAIIGTYGVASFSVARRTREIGVRMALGARPRSVMGMVLGKGMVLVAIGLAIGLAAALVSMRLIGALLVGVEPADPATLAAVAVIFALVVVAACSLPARRAIRVDPTVALRHE